MYMEFLINIGTVIVEYKKMTNQKRYSNGGCRRKTNFKKPLK